MPTPAPRPPRPPGVIRKIAVTNVLDWPSSTPQLVVHCPDDAPDIWLDVKAGNAEFSVEGAVLDEGVARSVLWKGIARHYGFESDLIDLGEGRWSYPGPLTARILRPPVGAPWLSDAVHGEWWGPDFMLNPVFVERENTVSQVLGRDFLTAFSVEWQGDGLVRITPKGGRVVSL